jgi:hypothetical protein
MQFYKGQSAIEYLTTYGWMLLVIAIIGGLLFALASDQELESETVQGLEDNDLVVEEVATSEEEGIQFNLRNKDPKEADNIELCLSNEELGVDEVCQTTKTADLDKLEESTIDFEGFKKVNRTYSYQATLSYTRQGFTEKTDQGTVELNYIPEKDENKSKPSDPELMPVDAIKSSAEFAVQANVPGLLDDETTKKLVGQRLPRPLIPQYNFNTPDRDLGQDYESLQTSVEFYIKDQFTEQLGITPVFEVDDIGRVAMYADELKFSEKLTNPSDTSSNPVLTGNVGLLVKLDVSEGEVGDYIQDINEADNNVKLDEVLDKNTLEGFPRWEISSENSPKALSLVLLDTNNNSKNLYGFGTTDKVSEMIDTVEGEKYDSTDSILEPEKNGYVNHVAIEGLRINESLTDTLNRSLYTIAGLNNTSISQQDVENLGFDTLDFAYSTNQDDRIALEANIRIQNGPTAGEMVNLTEFLIKYQNSQLEQGGIGSLEWLETDLKINAENQATFDIRIDEKVQRYQEIINNTASIAGETTG